MSYANQLTTHYADVRHRLLYGNARPRLLLSAAAPAIIDEPEAEEEIPPAVDLKRRRALDMLQPASWRFLAQLASFQHGISLKEMTSPARSSEITAARNAAMALMYQHTQMSTPAIGKIFHRDHSTVVHSLQKLGKNTKLVERLSCAEAERRVAAIVVVQPEKKYRNRQRLAALTRQGVRDGYREGVAVDAIAASLSLTRGSVKAIAHSMGLQSHA